MIDKLGLVKFGTGSKAELTQKYARVKVYTYVHTYI